MSQTHSVDGDDHPAVGHNRQQDTRRQQIIDAFTAILLTDRGNDRACLLDAVFLKAERSKRGKQPPPDPVLADLFLFEEGQMPRHTNLFNAELGILTERLLKALFEITRGSVVDTSDKAMTALQQEFEALKSTRRRQGRGRDKDPEWKKPDILFGASQVIECKYRFNSYEAKTKQIKVGQAYRDIGLSPVFLHLSPDFQHRKEFVDQGWEVYAGQDMIDYVLEHTGYDLRDLFGEVSAQPILRQRLRDNHQRMVEDQKSRLWSSYKYAPEEVQDDFHAHIMRTPRSVERLADEIARQKRSSHRSTQRLDAQELRSWTKELCDGAIERIPPVKKDAILALLMTLEEDDRAEVLTMAMGQSSERTQLTVASIYG